MIVTVTSLPEFAAWVLSRYNGESVIGSVHGDYVAVFTVDARPLVGARIGERIPIDEGTEWILDRAKSKRHP